MITLPDFIAIAIAALALYQLQDLKRQTNARLTTLERREPEKRVNPVVTPQGIEKIEAPKAGTVAAKAVKPVVYLSQVPHKAVQLDNGGLEWEGKP